VFLVTLLYVLAAVVFIDREGEEETYICHASFLRLASARPR